MKNVYSRKTIKRYIGRLIGCNPPDSVYVEFREPKVAIRTCRDASGTCAIGDAGAKLGDDPGWCNTPDPIGVIFREPKVAIRAYRDVIRKCVSGDTGAKLGD
jgi:hypothetical protein